MFVLLGAWLLLESLRVLLFYSSLKYLGFTYKNGLAFLVSAWVGWSAFRLQKSILKCACRSILYCFISYKNYCSVAFGGLSEAINLGVSRSFIVCLFFLLKDGLLWLLVARSVARSVVYRLGVLFLVAWSCSLSIEGCYKNILVCSSLLALSLLCSWVLLCLARFV